MVMTDVWRRLAVVGALGAAVALAAGCDDDEDTTQIDPREVGVDQSVRFDRDPLPDAMQDATPPPPDLRPDLQPVDARPPDQSPPDAEMLPDLGAVPACANGQDDDGDGLTDYPLDRGCTDPDDDDEADPAAPACANGLDDDDNGLIDHPADPGCAAADDPSEASRCGDHVVRDITDLGRVTGTTAGLPSRFDETCRANFAPEAVHRFTLRHAVPRLVFSTAGTGFDTLLDVRQGCTPDAPSLACNDDVRPGERTSEVVIEAPAPGDYFVVVDGFRDEQGPYVLTVRAELADGSACEGGAAEPPPPEDAGVDAGLDAGPDLATPDLGTDDLGPDAGAAPEPPPPPALRCGFGRACVAGICAPAACADGLDNDTDGRIDHPTDPGCTSPDDNDETSPDPLPQCANGRDDDFDGQTDFPNDPDCIDAADNDEVRPPACRDGLDNDGDGLIDLRDPGCRNDPDRNSEFNLEACRDAIDNDGDGLIDYPNDPGCEARLDLDETDPPEVPACANGVDDDGDGLVDFPADVGSCFFAGDTSEDDPCARREFQVVTGLRDVRGNNRGAPNDFSPSCGRFNDRDQTGGEALLRWDVAADRALAGMTLNTRGSDFDTVLAVTTQCAVDPAAELACDDDSGPEPTTSFLALGPQAPGTSLFILVDAGFAGAEGIFRVRILPELAEGANCGPPGEWTCAAGLECQNQAGGGQRCVPAACGNGRDDDGDGVIDFPNDPGCTDASDPSEADPPFPPQCANRFDDDGNGLIDFPDDPGCTSAADAVEGPACGDGLDNDGDGALDFPGDRGCACAQDPDENPQPQCNDRCDNDRDGLIDAEDPGCVGPEDNNEFHVPECQDGLDNNGDGRIDFPNDPGCAGLDGILERAPAVLPACANGLDDDGDGRIDYTANGTGDEGCASAADNDEGWSCDLPQTPLPANGLASGTTAGLPAGVHVGACSLGDAPEAVFRAELPYPAFVRIDTFGSALNTVLYARSTCGPRTLCPPDGDEPCAPASTQLACNDNTNGPQSEILFDFAGGPFHVFVDGFDALRGAWQLRVRATYPAGGECGPDSPSWATCEAGTECRAEAPEAPDAGGPEADAGLDAGADAGLDAGLDAEPDAAEPDAAEPDAAAPAPPRFTCQPAR